jgi:hypothetical protein
MKRILIAAILVTPFFAVQAMAQGNNPGQLNVPGPGPTSSKPASGGPREKAPPALPGARAEPTAVAPAAKNAMDLPPNEALFDAINRGDVAAAREAIGRGADIYGQNVLGLTPLELAVDLGRNNISFLLLSLRGGAGFRPTGAPPAAALSPAEQRRAERRAEEQARREQQAAARAADRGPAPAPAPPRTARLFAGDGGVPVPRAGFLGFDAAR